MKFWLLLSSIVLMFSNVDKSIFKIARTLKNQKVLLLRYACFAIFYYLLGA